MKWFKHDSDSHKNAKLEKVLIKYGADGYALYWMCLECIAAPIDATQCSFELEHDAEVLAHRLKIDSAKVEEIMRYFVQLGLFEINPETQIITCFQLARQLSHQTVRNPQLLKIKNALEQSDDASDKLRQVETSCDVSQHVSDNLRQVAPDIDIDLDLNTIDHFETFWKAYPKKVGRPAALKSFKKKRCGDVIDVILTAIEDHAARLNWGDPDKRQFIPNPATWLNQERWKDEFEDSTDDQFAGVI